MSDPYLGQIMQGCWRFAPSGYHMCDGALLSVNQYQALYSLMGNVFGGDGSTTFGLPNLAGRAAVGFGTSITHTPYSFGQVGGAETVQLTDLNLPSHTHTASFTQTSSSSSSSLMATTTKANSQTPAAGSMLGKGIDGSSGGTAMPQIYSPAGTTPVVALSGLNVSVNVAGTVAVNPSGSNSPVGIMTPFAAVATVIALVGIYPTRN